MTAQIQPLRKLYKRDKVARAIIDHLGARPSVEETEVAAVVAGTEAPNLDVVRVFKALQQSGCGEFVVGRKGRASRMRWSVDPRALVFAADGRVDELPSFDTDSEVEMQTVHVTEAAPRMRSPASGDLLRHEYNLRPGLVVRVDLPSSLSAAEAERLAAFIRSLPFK